LNNGTGARINKEEREKRRGQERRIRKKEERK